MSCKYCKDEFCVNDKCPYVADYCPVVQNDSICKFRKLTDKEQAIENLKKAGILTADGKIADPYIGAFTLKD